MPAYLPGLQFPIYSGWNKYTPVIPKMYWDGYSQEQIIKELCLNFDKLEHFINYMAELMNEWNEEFTAEIEEQLTDLWNAVNNGLENATKTWINEHLEFIYKYTIKQIYFALDDSGHLIAFIPEAWSDINFWTPLDSNNQETYGHLQILLNDVVPYVEMEY